MMDLEEKLKNDPDFKKKFEEAMHKAGIDFAKSQGLDPEKDYANKPMVGSGTVTITFSAACC